VVIYFYFFSRFDIIHLDSKTYKIEKNVTPTRRSQSLITLTNIRTQLDKLVESIVMSYPTDPKIARMKERFSNTILQEANPKEESERFKDTETMLLASDGKKLQTSYTINKGDVMVLCIRNVDGNLVDMNTLMYVAIHELAHILSSSLNHTPEFWQNMKLLKNHAVKIKLYIDRDYKTNPVPYCGIPIDSNIN